MDGTGWSRDLLVEVGGRGVINDAGTAALRLIADRTGLTGGLSRALARRGFTPVHDRGRVFADTAVVIADAAGCCRTWRRCATSASCMGRCRRTRRLLAC